MKELNCSQGCWREGSEEEKRKKKGGGGKYDAYRNECMININLRFQGKL